MQQSAEAAGAANERAASARLTHLMGLFLGIIVLGWLCVSAARGAVAAWLVFSPDVPGAATSGARTDIEQAGKMAPGDGNYAYWRAVASHQALLSRWLAPDAAAISSTALDDATNAASRMPANPYVHLLIGRLLLDLASRHDQHSDDAQELQAGGILALETALEQWPRAAMISDQAARILLDHWAMLESGGRSEMPALVRRTAHNAYTFRHLLPRVAAVTGRGDTPQMEVVRWLEASTPGLARPQRDLASVLTRLVGRDVRGKEPFGRAAIAAHLAAGTVGGPDLADLRRWQDTWRRYFPDEIESRWMAAQQITEAAPDSPDAWILWAEVAGSSGQAGEVRAAAERANDLTWIRARELLPNVEQHDDLTELLAAVSATGATSKPHAAELRQLRALIEASQRLSDRAER